MICPQCNAEYREGFVRCTDCGVQLVHPLSGALVAPSRAQDESPGTEEDPFCEFWRGDDPRLQGELCQVLDEAAIPFRSLQLNDVLSMVGIPSRQAIFRIGVPFSMFDRAERAVAEAFGGAAEADAAMYPTEENRAEARKLLDWPLKAKFRQVEALSVWERVTWKRKRKQED
jgi:hypothetical protein